MTSIENKYLAVQTSAEPIELEGVKIMATTEEEIGEGAEEIDLEEVDEYLDMYKMDNN